jgi:capsule polysaccharide modification protein KpsS
MVFHDVHLPTCLKNAKGTVTINSTVGLTSLGYGIPTITLGNAIYDIEGLTNKKVSLNDFWKESFSPNRLLYEKFIQCLIDKTQLNGSFYGLFPVEFEEKAMFD